MTIVKVETYVIKPEKQHEYMAIMKKWGRIHQKEQRKMQRTQIMETSLSNNRQQRRRIHRNERV